LARRKESAGKWVVATGSRDFPHGHRGGKSRYSKGESRSSKTGRKLGSVSARRDKRGEGGGERVEKCTTKIKKKRESHLQGGKKRRNSTKKGESVRKKALCGSERDYCLGGGVEKREERKCPLSSPGGTLKGARDGGLSRREWEKRTLGLISKRGDLAGKEGRGTTNFSFL